MATRIASAASEPAIAVTVASSTRLAGGWRCWGEKSRRASDAICSSMGVSIFTPLTAA